MHEDLFDLKQRLVKSLNELKTQKKHLDSRMAIVKGVNTIQPEKDMVDELQIAKSRYEEQEKRRSNAKLELEKLRSLLNEIESQEQVLLQVLEKHFSEVNVPLEERNASGTIKKIEKILQTKLEGKYKY
ncbi:uncharacterized protein [Parasteatoda tepidariorum]|uniref:uncharacterized protein n=1 Tax=Parasteatoda tepidariorum TaxID=114398 RepID=UPI001C71BF7D|nr:uncharacterized protein LOC122273110 [Parasteatoda tepidariorum]